MYFFAHDVKHELATYVPSNATVIKRKAKSCDLLPTPKRARITSKPLCIPSPVDEWLSRLPYDHRLATFLETTKSCDMNRPPSKRSRSSDSVGSRVSPSRDGSDTVASRDRKYSVYRDANYPVVLETKGSFMRPSKSGMVEQDRGLCKKLLATTHPLPPNDLFGDDHYRAFHANLRGRSEARICADLHPRIMPSVENLYIRGHSEYESFVEGHNDPWLKSILFYGPRPQPDHTIGYKWSNFDEQQRLRLNIEPTQKSFYTAREDIYFPFLTGEVKCGKQGLDLADRPNTHSMTIALRGVVELCRKTNRLDVAHRRVLGFSVSHDDHGVRLYAHYPEVDGEKTTYWRETLKEFTFGNDDGKDRWQCYHFTLNVCTLFALPFLERLKDLIGELPDPASQVAGLTTTLDQVNVQASQDDISATESQDETLPKPPNSRGLNAELRSMIQGLQRQLEQQRDETRERENLLQAQLERQNKELESQHSATEQQRKDFEQQRKDFEQQRKELMQLLKEALRNK